MRSIQDLVAYIAIVRAGSLTGAAQQLVSNKAHLSRLVKRLEVHCGGLLFERKPRLLEPTPLGRELYVLALEALVVLAKIDNLKSR